MLVFSAVHLRRRLPLPRYGRGLTGTRVAGTRIRRRHLPAVGVGRGRTRALSGDTPLFGRGTRRFRPEKPSDSPWKRSSLSHFHPRDQRADNGDSVKLAFVSASACLAGILTDLLLSSRGVVSQGKNKMGYRQHFWEKSGCYRAVGLGLRPWSGCLLCNCYLFDISQTRIAEYVERHHAEME